jgi:hypothetical protein
MYTFCTIYLISRTVCNRYYQVGELSDMKGDKTCGAPETSGYWRLKLPVSKKMMRPSISNCRRRNAWTLYMIVAMSLQPYVTSLSKHPSWRIDMM